MLESMISNMRPTRAEVTDVRITETKETLRTLSIEGDAVRWRDRDGREGLPGMLDEHADGPPHNEEHAL